VATETKKVLGQSHPNATTATTVYTVPASTQAVVSSIVICNQSATATTFRIWIAVNGAGDGNTQYLYYDVSLPGNDTFVITIGITLGAADLIRAYVGAATVSINVFGVEIS